MSGSRSSSRCELGAQDESVLGVQWKRLQREKESGLQMRAPVVVVQATCRCRRRLSSYSCSFKRSDPMGLLWVGPSSPPSSLRHGPQVHSPD